MTEAVNASDAALKLMNLAAYSPFKYLALDSSKTAYSTSQSSPISEITGNGGARATASVVQDTNTGVITMEHQWLFEGTVVVGAICPMNSATVG